MSEKEKDKVQTKRADRMAGRGPHKLFKMEIKKYTDQKKGDRTMKENETPKLDYWMLDVLKAAMRDYSRTRQPFISDGSLRGTSAFRFTELGKVELIREKLNEIQVFYDEEIKGGLK